MGSSALKAFSIAFALIGVLILYFAPEKLDPVISLIPLSEDRIKLLRNYVTMGFFEEKDRTKRSIKEDVSRPEKTEGKASGETTHRLFTRDELKKYDGGSDSLGLHLALLGEVFDVQKGAQHYKPGSGYAFFSGRDATRAYLTGDFNDETNADYVGDIETGSLAGLMDWLSFYREEYPYVGKLIGRYYDAQGNPTDELKTILETIDHAKSNKWLEDKEKEVFPPCNSEFSKDRGSRVWCTNKSGGVQRKWVGVPRMYYKAGKDARCVCVRDSGPPSNDLDTKNHNNVGDLEFPNLQEYPSCAKNSASCKVEHP